jgi:S-adenosylmethionine hydrolase
MRQALVAAASSIIVIAGYGAGCSAPPPVPATESRPRPIVALLTDFGTKDDAVALLRGGILSIARDATIVDLTQEVPPYDIEAGARALEDSPGIFPAGSVFVVVIDPGVGTERKAIAVELDNGSFLVGPDNGVLSLAMARYGVKSVRAIEDRRFMRSEVSSTFHGRDVFAPAGAHLAAGSPPYVEIGPRLESWVKLVPKGTDFILRGATGLGDAVSGVQGTVAAIDEPFGNVWTNIGASDLAKIDDPGEWRGSVGGPGPMADAAHPPTFGTKLVFELGDPKRRVEAPLVKTFGDVAEGKPLAYWSSRGRLALALNMGDAARTYGVKRGQTVLISRAP